MRIQSSSVIAVFAAIWAAVVAPASFAAEPLSDRQIEALTRVAVFGPAVEKDAAVKMLFDRGNPNIVPSLIFAMRYRRDNRVIPDAVSALTRTDIKDWKSGMLWQEAHPEVKPHPSYRDLKLSVFEKIDPEFMRFLGEERSLPENMTIRLEEITWGGVGVDQIPSLDNPKLISAVEADYLLPNDLVFGVAINGDVRAYPLRIMGWHEMFNETIGGVPVALAYCTLCGAGILFETQVEGHEKPLVFGSSGFLYRSNKLMFDRETDSLWNQFTGEPVSGPLLNSGITLKIRPVVITSWTKWRAQHPDSKVLSLETGHDRNYDSGAVYSQYFNSPNLMFPALVKNEETVRRKDYVFGIREFGAVKAWPLEAFKSKAVINDTVGSRNVVLVGDAATRTVRAYTRGTYEFEGSRQAGRVTGPGGEWVAGEAFLTSPSGEKLPRAPGHISYWFAWDGYLGVNSDLYKSEGRS